MSQSKSTFIFDSKYADAIQSLSDLQLGQLTRALLAYSTDGTLPSFAEDKAVQIAFNFLRKDIDERSARYEARCRRNRENARKRWAQHKKKQPARQPASAESSSAESQAQRQPAPSLPDSPSIDFDKFLAYWNRRVEETGSRMPRIFRITSSRRSLLKSRLRDYDGDTRVLRNAIEKALVCPFLNGSGKNRWVADLDWILSPRNFPRVLEGAFSNNEKILKPFTIMKQSTSSTSQNPDAPAKPAKTPDEEARDRYEGYVRLVNKTPLSPVRKVLEAAERNGELARLGVIWTPLFYQAQSESSKTAQL